MQKKSTGELKEESTKSQTMNKKLNTSKSQNLPKKTNFSNEVSNKEHSELTNSKQDPVVDIFLPKKPPALLENISLSINNVEIGDADFEITGLFFTIHLRALKSGEIYYFLPLFDYSFSEKKDPETNATIFVSSLNQRYMTKTQKLFPSFGLSTADPNVFRNIAKQIKQITDLYMSTLYTDKYSVEIEKFECHNETYNNSEFKLEFKMDIHSFRLVRSSEDKTEEEILKISRKDFICFTTDSFAKGEDSDRKLYAYYKGDVLIFKLQDQRDVLKTLVYIYSKPKIAKASSSTDKIKIPSTIDIHPETFEMIQDRALISNPEGFEKVAKKGSDDFKSKMDAQKKKVEEQNQSKGSKEMINEQLKYLRTKLLVKEDQFKAIQEKLNTDEKYEKSFKFCPYEIKKNLQSNMPLLANQLPDRFKQLVTIKYNPTTFLASMQKQFLNVTQKLSGKGFSSIPPSKSEYQLIKAEILNYPYQDLPALAAGILTHRLKHENRNSIELLGEELKKLDFPIREIRSVFTLIGDIKNARQLITFFNLLFERDAVVPFFTALSAMIPSFSKDLYDSDSVLFVNNFLEKISKLFAVQQGRPIPFTSESIKSLPLASIESPHIRIVNNTTLFLPYDNESNDENNRKPNVIPSFAIDMPNESEFCIKLLGRILGDLLLIFSYSIEERKEIIAPMWENISLKIEKYFEPDKRYISYQNVVAHKRDAEYNMSMFLLQAIFNNEIVDWCIWYSQLTDPASFKGSYKVHCAIYQLDQLCAVIDEESIDDPDNFYTEVLKEMKIWLRYPKIEDD